MINLILTKHSNEAVSKETLLNLVHAVTTTGTLTAIKPAPITYKLGYFNKDNKFIFTPSNVCKNFVNLKDLVTKSEDNTNPFVISDYLGKSYTWDQLRNAL